MEDKNNNRIIAYGSLMDMNNIQDSLDQSDFQYFYPVWAIDYMRSFNVDTHAGYASLGVVKQKGAVFNAVMFNVTDKGLQKLMDRETHYDLRPDISFADYMFQDIMGKALMFVPKIEHVAYNLQPRPIYLTNVRGAAHKISKSFGQDFDRTTRVGMHQTLRNYLK